MPAGGNAPDRPSRSSEARSRRAARRNPEPIPVAPAPPASRYSSPSFDRIPTVRTAQEHIESAFHRAAKVVVWVRDPFERMKATEIARVRSVQNTLESSLDKYVRRFPSFDRLPPFYRDLSHLLVDLDQVKKSLGAVDWAKGQIKVVGDEAAKAMKNTKREDVIRDAKAQAYGRIASLLKQIDRHLKSLDAARNSLRRLPMMDTTLPTIVVAGYPNVGKSSLIRNVSTAEPEIANYPFTTKGIAVGHFERRRVRYQIVDTPGLLDREFSDRNPIERQAILALQHLGDVILFMLDPSEYCGYPMKDQLKLLDDVRETFPEKPIFVAENKVDIKRPEQVEGRYQISTQTSEGVEELMAAVTAAAEPAREDSVTR